MMSYPAALTLSLAIFGVAMVLVLTFLWRLFDVFPIPWRWRQAGKDWWYWVVDWVRAKLGLPPL